MLAWSGWAVRRCSQAINARPVMAHCKEVSLLRGYAGANAYRQRQTRSGCVPDGSHRAHPCALGNVRVSVPVRSQTCRTSVFNVEVLDVQSIKRKAARCVGTTEVSEISINKFAYWCIR